MGVLFCVCFPYRQALWGVAVSAPHPLAHTHVSPLLLCMNYFLFGFAVYYFLYFLHFLGVFCKWAGSTGCYGWIGGGGRMLWGRGLLHLHMLHTTDNSIKCRYFNFALMSSRGCDIRPHRRFHFC